MSGINGSQKVDLRVSAKKGRYTGFKPVTGFKLVRAQREGERSESETGFERSENNSKASPNLEIETRILQKDNRTGFKPVTGLKPVTG